MNPYLTYQEQYHAAETRINLLLQLFDRAITRLEQAEKALVKNDPETALPLLVKAQLLVEGIASGVDVNQGDLARDLLRLYEFAVYAIRAGTLENVRAALRVLRPLYEGFCGIQVEAVELERKGAIPHASTGPAVQAIA